MSVVPESGKPLQRARRAAPRAVAQPESHRPNRWWILLVLVALLAGMGIGALIMRVRYQRQWKEVVVSINGQTITKDQFFNRLEQAAGTQVIRQMTAEELAMQYAKKVGAIPTDAEVEARLAQEKKKPDFKENLARSGRTEKDLKHALRISMSQAAVLNKGVTVNEGDIRTFYEANTDKKNPQARYYTPEKVQIAVIVTKTEEQSKKARADLDKGIPWPTVVKNYSQDDSKKTNGILPPTLKGRTKAAQVKGLEETIFGLRIGQQIGPTPFAGAWWIIRCLDKQREKTTPFEQVKEEARTGAMLMKGLPANAKKVQSDYEEFQKKAVIQAFWTRYKEAVSVK